MWGNGLKLFLLENYWSQVWGTSAPEKFAAL
jgi:hypothetical protein